MPGICYTARTHARRLRSLTAYAARKTCGMVPGEVDSGLSHALIGTPARLLARKLANRYTGLACARATSLAMAAPRQLLLRCSTTCIPAVVRFLRPRHTAHPIHKIQRFE